MALSDKNIVITPNIGSANDPKIVFSGADASTAAQNITLTAYPTNGGTLSFDGSAGQLFSVTNSMSGTIFSANDVSGIPSIEVLDTGLVKLAQYSGNVLLGTGTDTGLAKLQVTGSLSLTGNMLYSSTGRSIYGPNVNWSSYLYVGGDGVNGISRTGSIASIVTTNGNMHIDSGSDKAMYLNYYSGTGGIVFGNGSTSSNASISAGGLLTAAAVTITNGGTGSSSALNVSGDATVYRSATGGVLYFGSNRNNYIQYDGSNYNLGGSGGLYVGGNVGLTAANYSSYALPLSGGTLSGPIYRSAAAAGYLNGNYSSSESISTSGAIYSIGGNYVPSTTGLNNMYGIGYGYSGNAGITATGAPNSQWGFYVASAGTSRIFLNSDSGNGYFNGSLYAGGNLVLNSSNYNSYSPTLTGGGASGTWSINISGNAGYASGAGSATTADNIDGWGFVNTGNNSPQNADTIDSNGISYYSSGVANFSGNATDGALYSHYYSYNWQHQIAGDFRSGQIAVRGKNNGTWQSWYTVPTISIQDSAPAGTRGNLWWQSSTGKLKIYYYDGNTSQWVDAVPIPDTSTFYSKAGGAITGPVVINSSLETSGYAKFSGFKIGQGVGGGAANARITTASTNAGMGLALYNQSGTFGLQLYAESSSYGFLNAEWGGWDLQKVVGGVLNINGNTALHAGNYTSYAVSTTYNSSLNSDSRNSRGVTRLYRRDDDSDYSIQHYWTGSYWNLRGYNADSYHAGVQVAYSDSAGSSGSCSGNAATATRAAGNFYIDTNYGRGIVGVYDSYRYQGVFFMGDSYKMADDGTSLSNMYGIGWSHPNAGGAAGNLTDHGMLIINNGGFRCAISNSIVASANITAYSDERLKTNWRDMPENYVARLAQVKVGIYDRTDEEDITQVGVSAQSLQKLLPQAIMTAKDDMQTLSVSYGNAALASAVELAKEVVDLRERVAKLENLLLKLIKD